MKVELNFEEVQILLEGKNSGCILRWIPKEGAFNPDGEYVILRDSEKKELLNALKLI